MDGLLTLAGAFGLGFLVKVWFFAMIVVWPLMLFGAYRLVRRVVSSREPQ